MTEAEQKSDSAMEDLKEYLLSHEDDIAFGINDFGDLKQAFIGFFGREAESIDHLGRVVK